MKKGENGAKTYFLGQLLKKKKGNRNLGVLAFDQQTSPFHHFATTATMGGGRKQEAGKRSTLLHVAYMSNTLRSLCW